MKKQKVVPMLLGIVFMVFSCGKGDDTPDDPDPVQEEMEQEETEVQVLTGVFIDAAVEGLGFKTASQSGTTNASGEFSYVAGEEVTFSLGNVELGTAPGQETITPITLAQTVDPEATIASQLAQNIAALLQTLDTDGDESNGITIAPEVANALGVETIDFSQPVEAILADIVLSVVQSTGIELEIVYPGDAAEAMGESLGISYEAPENVVLTYLIPTLKAFFETWDNNYTSTSAIYKTTYDTNGDLTTLDVLARYSGKQFFKMDVMALNASGLPENLMFTTYFNNRLTGSFGVPEFTNQMVLQYNAQNQVSSLGFMADDGSIFNDNQFTSYDENNKPLSFFRDLAPDDPNRDFTISWDLTYANDLIATAKRVFDNLTTGDFPSHFISTREFTYNYNQYHNVSSITYSRVFDDTYTLDGEQVQQVSESSVEDVFTYDGNQKLVSYTENAVFLEDGSTFTTERTYDENEQITLVEFVGSDGFESTTNFNGGVATTTESYNDGLLTSEVERFSDGSQLSTYYYYDEEGQLIEKEIIEYDPNFRITDRIITLYNPDGSIWVSYDQDFDANGVLIQETGTDGNGEIFGVWYFDANFFLIRQDIYFEGELNYYIEFEYDANGFRIRATDTWPDGEVFGIRNFTYNSLGFTETITYSTADGEIYLTEEWAYDADNFLATITAYRGDGTLSYIVFYEAGVLVRQEIYDENGELEEVIDYTDSGKRSFAPMAISKVVTGKTTPSFEVWDALGMSEKEWRSTNPWAKQFKAPVSSSTIDWEKLPAQLSPKIEKIRRNK